MTSRSGILQFTSMTLKALLSPWAAALLFQLVLGVVLFVKRMWRRFPFFFAYSIVTLLLDAGMIGFHQKSLASPLGSFPRRLYFSFYWVNEAIGLLLGLGVIYEVFRHLLAPYPALRKLAGQFFYGVVALLVLLGFVVLYAQSVHEPTHTQAAFLVMEQAGRVLEVGLLLFLFLFASAFGLHWRQYVFGIVLGLGIFASVELVAVTMRAEVGRTAIAIFNIARSVSFNCSLVIWISYILAPELATQPAEVPKRAQLEQWNKAVMELIYR